MTGIPYPTTLANCRTVGGMSAGSSSIRPAVLYRCAAPVTVDEQITGWVEHSGISRIFDLRSEYEARRVLGFPEVSGRATRTRLPLMEGAFAVGSTMPDLESLYLPLVLDHPTVWAQVAEEVATNEGATLVHCTAGKDRTGVAIALLLLAVGADRDAVFEDYAASTANLQGSWLQAMRTQISAAGIPVTEKMLELMVGTSVPGLDRALGEIERRHGSVADYLLAHGLERAGLEQLGSRLLA
ncbi:tyrosine-protein phosphatase [Glutamicibacter sp. MNS18]|uniref:tyrosine-protein phosphatase n=1 Tax=Glutamicibacter sp. MNS18 TaxID=2989817 RepID=UPI002235D9F2|nr:tyrosine-protein phosphatase [Glutamicibacter sp. MNS18]MCW4467051.1 tyrosine-protein phosphatase [Glutamicibacter sp. MNS18]